MSNVGFVGLGVMGKPMALNLIKGGHTLFLTSRSGVPKELTDAGGKAWPQQRQDGGRHELDLAHRDQTIRQ